MTDQSELQHMAIVELTRGEAIGRLALFGTVMAILQGRATAQNGTPGSYSNSAMAIPQQQMSLPRSEDDLEKAVKSARAMRSGSAKVRLDATVAEMDHEGTMTVLRKGSNGWICTPGNENKIGIPRCASTNSGCNGSGTLLPENLRLRIALLDCVTCFAGPRSIATTRPSIGRALPFP